MFKRFNKLNEVVHLWDLDKKNKNDKIQILKIWMENLSEDEFGILLDICSNFNYYSEKLTAQVYKKLYENNISKPDDVEIFLSQSLFFPLRKKDRIESAVDMFSSFRLVNNIDANRTKIICPADYLINYNSNYHNLKKLVEENDLTDKNDNERIQNLNQQLINIKNETISKKIEKKIINLKKGKNNREQRLNKRVELFNENYFSVKNMIIIDDFIGTGDSVVSFLKKIGKSLKENDINIKINLWVIEASKQGLEAIEDIVTKFELDMSISYYKESIDVLVEEKLFPTQNIRDVQEIIRGINKRNNLKPSRYCRNHAIASFVNAPNNNLTLLSENSFTWNALFPRTKRNKEERIISRTELKEAYDFLRK
ncbi:hypothetical protein SAMN04488134_107160 [Amphibacillus marinus]|uniref:PRTase-CE domain-containing protein n=1 Tax=Amphibacillus marinus TaxID=872970 RepID=A0A1H8PSI5_9BACI|nr:hypothetical protein [Amphibacillus marinus]SEO44513.1 hypothetical protein SAMN04488134_107160 [Amphibacillus marinus]